MVDALTAALAAFAGGMLVFIVIASIVVYIYTAIVLMVIAQKTKTPNAWLAWIPIERVPANDWTFCDSEALPSEVF